MKLREKIKNPEPRNLSEVLKDCHDLVDDLRSKLKKKCDEVLDLRKEIDRLQEYANNLEVIEKSHQELNGQLQKQIDEFARSPRRSTDDV